MPALPLTAAERREKRAEAHHLDPVVMIGAEGLTPAVQKEVDLALQAHGLIKVRVASDDRDERARLHLALADALGAAPVQHIGRLLVLWRPPAAKLAEEREGRGPGPKTVKLLKFSRSGNHRPQVKMVKVLGNMRLTAGGTLKRAKKRSSSVKKASQQS